MKTKLILTGIASALIISVYSFKNVEEKESSNVALVTAVNGDNEGYLIIYGDGSTESVPFRIKRGSGENALLNTATTATVMNKLHDKGYRFVAVNTTPNSSPGRIYSYMIFEKN